MANGLLSQLTLFKLLFIVSLDIRWELLIFGRICLFCITNTHTGRVINKMPLLHQSEFHDSGSDNIYITNSRASAIVFSVDLR